MKKYGDLLSCGDIDLRLSAQLKNIIVESSEFNVIWEEICASINDGRPDNISVGLDQNSYFNDENYLNFTIHNFIKSWFDKTLPNPYLKCIREMLNNDENVFSKLLTPEISLYREDVRRSLLYNYGLDNRKDKIDKIDIYNDTIDLIVNPPNQSNYFVPFDLVQNKYNDFCAFTWKSLFLNSHTIECIKDNGGNRKYINSQTFSNIIKIFSRPNSGVSVSNNDQWLIEKIFGINTILPLIPAINEYYTKENLNIIFMPLLDILLKCKPICIRKHLANLVGMFLSEIPTVTKESPYYNTYNNKMYDDNIISKLTKELNNIIPSINKTYSTLLNFFYEATIIPFKYPVTIVKAETNQLEILDLGPLDLNSSQTKDATMNPIDVANNILLPESYSNRADIISKLLKCPHKRNYNSSDLAWRYGILQLSAIHFIYDNMKNIR